MAKKKRIAFYIGSLCTGGAERVMCNLAEYFHASGYDVFMVTKLVDEPEYVLNPEIPRIIADITKDEETGSRVGNLKARINKLTKIWEEINPDIIVSFIKKNNLMALASAKKLKIPVVVSVRSAPERELSGRGIKLLSMLLFRGAAGVVLQTTEAKEFFPKTIQKKVTILPNSLNPEFIKYADEIKSSTEKTERKKQIITVGRIDDNKNQRMLVEAFKKIASRHPDWTLHLYGDGEGRSRLEADVKEAGYEDQILFHGVVSDVPNRMAEASIFVLPSKIEGMPNALIEAMAMGMACISTDCPCGGPRDLIEQDKNGVLIPVDDVDVLAKNLSRLMSDDELRDSLSREAQKIVELLHPDFVNKEWNKYIDGIIEGNGKA